MSKQHAGHHKAMLVACAMDDSAIEPPLEE